MDVYNFVQRRGTFSLMALRSAYAYLRAVQLDKHYVEYSDVCQGMKMGAELTNPEIVAHNSLIYGMKNDLPCLFDSSVFEKKLYI